uniref:F-box associated beta-propeller type 1 domain-containing protein n=1 Tax=Brassica oleracea var. oleracea TaxID=109376 RepID=A0A0D3ADU5_BRAOL
MWITVGRKQFLQFMVKDFRVCSLKFDLQGIRSKENFVHSSIKQVSVFDPVAISQIFQCEGLLLCVTKDKSRLLVWNPYLGKMRWIQPRNSFHMLYNYAIGYDKNQIWVTDNKIEVSWSKFLRTTFRCMDGNQAGSFFIDEEKKIVVVVDLESYKGGIVRNQKTNVIGQDVYFKSVNMGKAN